MLGNQLAPEETRKSKLDSSVLAPEALITNGQTVELPAARATWGGLSLIHISEPTRRKETSRMPSSA